MRMPAAQDHATQLSQSTRLQKVQGTAAPTPCSSRLFVQNLPSYLDNKRLRDHFGQQGEVTDAVVIKTKDGKKSRRFGFIGYKTEKEAIMAQEFFDHSFLDTCRLNVTFAISKQADGDAVNPVRPWSKYSVGSSRNEQNVAGTVLNDAPIVDIPASNQIRNGVRESEATSAEYQEFMETMQARSKSKFWANDDVQATNSGGSMPKITADESAKLFGHESDEEGEEVHDYVIKDELSTNKKTNEISDMDFLRSKVNKRFDQDERSSDDEASTGKQDDMPISSRANPLSDDVPLMETPDKPTARLFVRNLPFTAVEEDLTELFAPYGTVIEVHMPLDETKRRKGFGFVSFKNTVDAQTALNTLNGVAFQGRRLHVLDARLKAIALDTGLENPSLTYKQKKELARQSQANQTTGWNASYIRSDATIGTLAERMGVQRGEIMDKEQGNMAVRLAIGETMLVQENKAFFAQAGVDLDAIEGALVKTKHKIERSTTVILVKNLPYTTQEEELAQLFRKFGDLGRFLLAPSKTLALVEFFEPTEARKAFRSLAYKKFQHVPLYLEWAPLQVFTLAKSTSGSEAGVKELKAGLPLAESFESSAESLTICIKNLNFDTTEKTLENLFQPCGTIRKVTIARRKDPKRGLLSMGFGFVEFTDAQHAKNAIETFQSRVVDGHALKLVPSQQRVVGSKRQLEETSLKGRHTKMMVRNVAFEATSHDIRALFGAFGQLKRVRMPKKFDGRHRGFAFVEFLTEQEAQSAYRALGNSHLYGRHLVLEWAEGEEDIEALRAKASKDVEAIHESERRKRMKTSEYEEENNYD